MILTFDPTETKMVGKVEEEEVARCQVVSTADINTREEALLPATKSFSMISKPSETFLFERFPVMC